MSAEDIHAIGFSEVARIRAEMEALKDEVGFKSDLAAFFTYLRTDPRFFHTDPLALLAEYREMSRRIDPELVKVFRRMPRMPYGIIPRRAAGRRRAAAGGAGAAHGRVDRSAGECPALKRDGGGQTGTDRLAH